MELATEVVQFVVAATLAMAEMVMGWIVEIFSRYIFPCLVAYLVALGFIALFKGIKSFARALGVTAGACLLLVVGELPTFLLWWPIILRDFFGWEFLRIVWPDPRPDPFVWYVFSRAAVVGLQLLVPFKILTWLLGKEIIRRWLESWWWWVKVLYMYMASYLIALFAATQTRDTFFGSIWGVSFLFCLWCGPAGIFYYKLAADEKARVAPPRWVGNDTTIRHSFWLGLVLQFSRWVVGCITLSSLKTTTPDTSFGAGHEATLGEIEQAELL